MSKYYSDSAIALASVRVGDRLATLKKHPNEVDVVRFCAAIRNFHRFHYDRAFTANQGIDEIIVPGFLTGNWCIEAVTRAFEPGLEVCRLKFRNTRMAPVAEDYVVIGEVSSVSQSAPQVIQCSLEVRRQATEEVVTTGVVGVRRVSNR